MTTTYIYRASLKSARYSFEAYGFAAGEARAALIRCLEGHAAQYGIASDWWNWAGYDLHVRRHAIAVGYRDGAPLHSDPTADPYHPDHGGPERPVHKDWAETGGGHLARVVWSIPGYFVSEIPGEQAVEKGRVFFATRVTHDGDECEISELIDCPESFATRQEAVEAITRFRYGE